LGLSGPVPRRVDAATKAGLLRLIDRATAAGWEHRRACGYLELAEGRAWRWYERREAGRLEDHRSGAGAVHGLLASERAAIIALFDAWGEIDRSHRKLAHRGSYEGVVWVSPATVRRVLAANGLILRRPRRAGRSERRPFPEWATYTRNSIWIYDTTHFKRCPATAVITVMDLVTRKWICEIVSTEETSTQVQVAFTDALELEGLLDAVDARVAGYADRSLDDAVVPILLAVSDNGPQMTSGSTREFMAMCAIAQHFGRPHTPTDQAWIESLFSHIKADWPHLDAITDPAVLRAELELVRVEYNTVRLHAGIGYVTPDDEHEGRGPQIRRARRVGLMRARRQRIAYHRLQRHQRQPPQSR
jgi:transposase InsO family protein